VRRWFALLSCAIALSGCSVLQTRWEGLQRGAEWFAIGFGILRLPVTLQTPEPNVCLDPEQRVALDALGKEVRAGRSRAAAVTAGAFGADRRPRKDGPCYQNNAKDPRPDRIDTLEDLLRDETIFLVALSGGGARAARLSTYALATLEQRYNELASSCEACAPLWDTVHGFSTVSGGSVYAAHLAYELLDWSETEDHRDFFSRAAASREVSLGTKSLGPLSALAYLSPTNLFLLPVITFFSDRTYLDILAHSINYSQRRPLFFRETLLGDLPARPRFLFNAVEVRHGVPFVITQRVMNMSSEVPQRWTARIDLPRYEAHDPARPFLRTLTLEDLNSSPGRFPIAYAAMASAAFPPVMEPLQARRFRRDSSPSDEVFLLTDGGVFDNSGLATAVDLFEYVAWEASREAERNGEPCAKRLLLLAVNADTSTSRGPLLELGLPNLRNRTPTMHVGRQRKQHSLSDSRDTDTAAAEDPATQAAEPQAGREWGVAGNWPIRELGGQGVDRIHFLNKRRSEQIAWRRIEDLVDTFRGRCEVDALYFPVSLAQLYPGDPFFIEPDPDSSLRWEKVLAMPTDFVISGHEDRDLRLAAQTILEADQSTGCTRPEAGWAVGPDAEMVYRLEDALSLALIRAQEGRWEDIPAPHGRPAAGPGSGSCSATMRPTSEPFE
jgi:hypothetical protein